MAWKLSANEAQRRRGVVSRERGVDEAMEIDAVEVQSPRRIDPWNHGSTRA